MTAYYSLFARDYGMELGDQFIETSCKEIRIDCEPIPKFDRCYEEIHTKEDFDGILSKDWGTTKN